MTKTISLLILTALFFTACNKTYEDDPYFVNFRSPEARIHGTWDLESLMIGDHDSTAAVKNQPCYVKLSFQDDRTASSGGGGNLVGFSGFPDTCYLEGGYQFTDKHNELCLAFGISDMRFVGPFPSDRLYPGYPDKGTCWKIEKLTGSQLWISTTFKNSVCRAHLKKIS